MICTNIRENGGEAEATLQKDDGTVVTARIEFDIDGAEAPYVEDDEERAEVVEAVNDRLNANIMKHGLGRWGFDA